MRAGRVFFERIFSVWSWEFLLHQRYTVHLQRVGAEKTKKENTFPAPEWFNFEPSALRDAGAGRQRAAPGGGARGGAPGEVRGGPAPG